MCSMAKSLFHYQSHSRPSFPYTKLRPLTIPSSAISHFPINVRFQGSVKNPDPNRLHLCNSSSTSRFSLPISPTDGDSDVGLVEVLKGWMVFIRSFLPGGSWWDLCDPEEDLDATLAMAKPVTVLHALRRMWALVEDRRLAIFAAFASLTVAAFAEISIPNLLASSIFSAQNGETVAFHKTSQLMVFLCFISGICRLKHIAICSVINSLIRTHVRIVCKLQWLAKWLLWNCKHDPGLICTLYLQSVLDYFDLQLCFSDYLIFTSIGAFDHILQLKRLRETLYTSLIFQDISFFDRETVGDMTSRLGADCQRLSHVIGNDVHLILRNFLQGTGALVSLLTLSWPLALSTLVICSILSAIFLIYGLYQKKAAKIAQEFTACANEVKAESRLYKQWLDRLAFTSVREAAAFGFWNLSFNVLYRFTQVFAVLLGGMSILTGHASAEQLTKYVLYCEWLIYATWRIGGNMSSLFQSIGASEKVFQLMNLVPSNQFLLKGVKLQRLTGNIEFLDVSFYYPSRIEVPTLEHVNMSIKANEVVAIIGPSGSGKSTIVNLLLRLYEPTHGQILVDGVSTIELDIRWLRENIGYVGQGVLHAFRSNGKAKRTVIIIAHRLSTIKAADRLVVMEDGRIVEMGDHQRLLHESGLYRRLVGMQMDVLG
ncbi:hypothetical protein RJ639_036285 [Escallonia herrerae]|uniref:ABC transmembrane type-1 domain-containing protein n=1 Tax=Escallonia herrerae TaxID=1293975 RepID=A0AA89BHI5_9ASTE|nr:hypothetical protein RJ639_036285 [Escallonia herrerae]